MADAESQVSSQVPTFVCKLCGYAYPEAEGRLHGRQFTCEQCGTADRTLRRNLGESTDMQQWTQDEVFTFYRNLRKQREEGNGRLQWKTIRSCMLNTLTQRAVTRWETSLTCESLPMSVWQNQGWEPEVVKLQPCEWSETYQCWTYRVPKKKMKWSQAREEEEAKLLQRERDATQKRRAKGKKSEKPDEDSDLDVPDAVLAEKSKGDKTARTEARQAAAAEKKVLTENQKISGQAAKALGPLTTAMTSMDKVWAKAEACAQVDEDTKRCCAEIRSRLQTWRKAAHDAVNLQERNAAADKENVAPLVALPFTAEDLKILLKQNSEAGKSVKNALPKKEKRVKQAEQAQEPAAEGAAPKRRRTKTPA